MSGKGGERRDSRRGRLEFGAAFGQSLWDASGKALLTYTTSGMRRAFRPRHNSVAATAHCTGTVETPDRSQALKKPRHRWHGHRACSHVHCPEAPRRNSRPHRRRQGAAHNPMGAMRFKNAASLQCRIEGSPGLDCGECNLMFLRCHTCADGCSTKTCGAGHPHLHSGCPTIVALRFSSPCFARSRTTVRSVVPPQRPLRLIEETHLSPLNVVGSRVDMAQ